MIVSWRQMIGALNNAAGHVCRSPQPAAPAANTALPRFSPNALLICALHASIYALLCTVMPLPLLCIVLPLYFVTQEVGCILSLDGFLTNPTSNTGHGDVIAKKIAM